jgi:hypothetical protein
MLNLRSDETDALALIEDVQVHQPGCGLVVIDTLSRNLAGGNENAAEDRRAHHRREPWRQRRADHDAAGGSDLNRPVRDVFCYYDGAIR